MAVFSDTKQYAELSQEEIDGIEERCEQFRLLQKGNFYPEDVSSGAASSQDATRQ